MTNLNKTNIDKVIEIIRDESKYFDMNDYTEQHGTSEDYGTASGICGWANFIRLIENGETLSTCELRHASKAATWLGLNQGINELFYCSNQGNVDLSGITRDRAIMVLENLKETGEVDWGITQA